MKPEKIIKTLLATETSGRTSGFIALIAGLAAGAVLGVLFAPKSGGSAREKLRQAASRLFDRGAHKEEDTEEIHAPQHNTGKRPKSDIRNLIHEAHLQAASADHITE